MLDKTKNYKIDVSQLDTVERTKLQEELFKMGYSWYEGGQKVTCLDSEALFLEKDMDITCGNKKDFSRYDYPILTVSDIMTQTEERTLRDWFAGLAMVQIMQTHDDDEVAGWSYHFADMMLKERATHSTHSVPPSDSKTEKAYGVVDTPKNAVQPVFHIGDKIRFKSTGTIEKVHYITGGGRFVNSVDVEDVELIKES